MCFEQYHFHCHFKQEKSNCKSDPILGVKPRIETHKSGYEGVPLNFEVGYVYNVCKWYMCIKWRGKEQ